MSKAVLALDFDGVLHPAGDAVFVDFSRPAWELSMQLRTQGRFVWLDQLREALEGTNVHVLVHSTWRRRLTDATMRELLGPEVGSRLIMTDHWIDPQRRRDLSHAGYIYEALSIWQEQVGALESLCVLDDRPELFVSDGELLRLWHPTYIWTSSDRGLNDASVQQILRDWATACHHAERLEATSSSRPVCE